MTGDLELFLRGQFVNRWRCRHLCTQEFNPMSHSYRYVCQICGCVATIMLPDLEEARSGAAYWRDLEFVRE